MYKSAKLVRHCHFAFCAPYIIYKWNIEKEKQQQQQQQEKIDRESEREKKNVINNRQTITKFLSERQ